MGAGTIRKQGFDRAWKKFARVSSVLCYGTDNIGVDAIRELLNLVHEIPTLEDIHSSIRSFRNRRGKRPTFHQSEWMTELGRSASAVDKVLRRHFESTLAKEVRVALGNKNDGVILKAHEVFRFYWSRGIWIANKFGQVPELGMTSIALNGRLNYNHGTTLANVVEKILGPKTKPEAPDAFKSQSGYLQILQAGNSIESQVWEDSRIRYVEPQSRRPPEMKFRCDADRVARLEHEQGGWVNLKSWLIVLNASFGLFDARSPKSLLEDCSVRLFPNQNYHSDHK